MVCVAGKKVVSIGAGHSHSAAVTSEGELYMWGMKNYLEPQLLKVPKHTPHRQLDPTC